MVRRGTHMAQDVTDNKEDITCKADYKH
jgi:hypothetical protein